MSYLVKKAKVDTKVMEVVGKGLEVIGIEEGEEIAEEAIKYTENISLQYCAKLPLSVENPKIKNIGIRHNAISVI